MPKPRKLFAINKQTKALVGVFHDHPGVSGKPSRLVLCSLDEFLFKSTSRGPTRRSEAEREIFAQGLHAAKLEALKKEKVQRPPAGPSMKTGFQTWLDSVAISRDAKTVVSYRSTATYYLESAGDHPIANFTRRQAESLYAHLERRKFAAASINTHMTQLATFLNFAVEEGWLQKRPKRLPKPRLTKREYRVFTPAQINEIEGRIRSQLAEPANHRQQQSLVAQLRAWVLIRNTGMRGGEAVALTLGQINLSGGYILVGDVPEIGFQVKGRRERRIPINDSLAEFLRNDIVNRSPQERFYLDKGDGHPYFKNVQALGRALAQYKQAMGLQHIKQTHGLRGSVATLLGGGIVAQEVLGHQDIKTTRGYADANQMITKEALNKLPGPNTIPKNER